MNRSGVRLSDCIAPKFFPVHLDIRRRGHREYWLRGGRGSTKSSFISLEIVLGLLRDPLSNAIVYRRVASTLRESVYEQLIWAIDRLGLSAHFRYRLAPLEIDYLPTGQRILFRGADDPGKSKSIKLARGYFAFLWFEELAEFSSMEDIRTIKASILRGAPDQARSVVFYSYNPPAARNNWVNAEALLPLPDRLVHESCYLDVPAKWLGEDFIAEAETLRQTNERAYRHMYLGEVTGTGGQVFDNLRLRPLTAEEERADRAYNGLDFGFAVDPDAYVRAAYDPRTRRLWLLDEFWGVRTPVEQLAEELLSRAQGEVIRCDSAEPRMIAQLRERGLHAIAAKKGAGSVAGGLRWLQERAEIIVDPERCPHAARELSGYAYPPGPGGTFLPEFPDRDNHTIDALRYAMEPVMEKKSAHTWGVADAERPKKGRSF
mgnify:CR=1 FL=1